MLFPDNGQPALSPVRLMLILVLQFMEGLLDRQLADTVRLRFDWKHLFCLELTDPGFDSSVLCELRARLLEDAREQKAFAKILACAQAEGYLKKRGQ